MMRVFKAIFLIMLFSSLAISLSLASSSGRIILSSSGRIVTLTWLHTDGRYIKNEYGQTVWLRGAAFPDLSFQLRWGGWIDTGWDNFVRLSGGKANVIRCAMSPRPWNKPPELPDPYPDHPELFDQAVDQLVSWASANNVYVILDFHGWGTWEDHESVALNPTPWINWILHFISRYKNNPTVAGFEIFNEPWQDAWGSGNGTLGRQRFIDAVTKCCEAISDVNPNALIIVPSMPFSEVMQYWLDNPLPYNVVYGWDQYYRGADYNWCIKPYVDGNFDLGYERWRQKLYHDIGRVSVEYNLPVIGTEFAWVLDPKDPGWQYNANHWFSMLSEWETHWYYWYFPVSNSQGSICYPDINTLSPVGEIWKKYIGPSHRLNVQSIVVVGQQAQNISALVEFNGVPFKSTPTSIYAGETEHTLSVPETVTLNGINYSFVRWEDGSTSPTRTINLTTDINITAFYG